MYHTIWINIFYNWYIDNQCATLNIFSCHMFCQPTMFLSEISQLVVSIVRGHWYIYTASWQLSILCSLSRQNARNRIHIRIMSILEERKTAGNEHMFFQSWSKFSNNQTKSPNQQPSLQWLITRSGSILYYEEGILQYIL